MKKLGFGLMRLPVTDPRDESSIDMEKSAAMVDLFMSRGFSYFDTGWMYHGFKSESAAKTLLTDRYPRKSFALATKLHAGFVNSPEDRDKIFETQLEKTGAGYFDRYLLHGVDSLLYPKYEELKCFDFLREKKERGLVKHIGFSFHDTPELLGEILRKHPETEFVQLQINYLDWESRWVRSRECYETAEEYGKPVIVMEPVKGGTLANLPEKAKELFQSRGGGNPAELAIRFAASLPGVETVLSGMSDLDQVDANTSFMENFTPLRDDERDLCFKAAEIINGETAIPCTGCSYCAGGCPRKIAIPQYFSLYNEDMREDLAVKGWTVNFSNYEALIRKFGKASDCIACGRCESVCPQHLPIIENLKKVAGHYGK